jgi:hypothetical protein
MTSEKTLTPRESLAVIREAINKTKDDFRSNSFYFLLWGWLIAAASVSFFLLHEYTTFKYYFLPFPILTLTGIVASLTWYFRQRSAAPTETYSGYFFNRLWLVLGIGFIVVVFVSVSQKLPPFLFTLVIAAIGTLLSGLSMQFKPLIIGGVLIFLAAIVGVYVPDTYKPLLLGVTIILGYLVPGYLLKSAKV